jgi:hypothetical protein
MCTLSVSSLCKGLDLSSLVRNRLVPFSLFPECKQEYFYKSSPLELGTYIDHIVKKSLVDNKKAKYCSILKIYKLKLLVKFLSEDWKNPELWKFFSKDELPDLSDEIFNQIQDFINFIPEKSFVSKIISSKFLRAECDIMTKDTIWEIKTGKTDVRKISVQLFSYVALAREFGYKIDFVGLFNPFECRIQMSSLKNWNHKPLYIFLKNWYKSFKILRIRRTFTLEEDPDENE